jgi:HSP20 family protein
MAAKEVFEMATLIRRETRDPVRRHYAQAGLDPFRMMEALLGGDVFASLGRSVEAPAFAPTFEVRETKDAYVFKADVPGVVDKDIDIQLTGNVLTIAGERKQETVQDGDRYFAVERAYGRFSRAFSLPDGTDAEHVTADVKDGVLTLRVPKKPEVQARRVPIGAPPTGNAKA